MKLSYAILAAWIAALAMWCISEEARTDTPAPALNKQQKIARNYTLATKLYQGYVNLPRLGYVNAWEADDYAPGRVLGVFDRTGKFKDSVRRWKEQAVAQPKSWKDEDRVEYVAILKVLPDYHAVTPYKGFCDDKGCALQLCIGGHDKDGKYYEDSEALFFWTNDQGKITRMEAFDDWVNMPDLLGRLGGLPAAQMDYTKWGAAIKKIAGEEKKQP